jgi:Protein of unknown function (DUF4031)
MVYVGTMEFGFGRMKMFHMSSPNMDELHRMADLIGVKRKWFQEHYKGTDFYHPHYDVCKSKKELAIMLGATEINDRELIKICFPKMHGALRKKA